MEERREFGFRVRPSFGQVLGYIQEGEPMTLELPKRNASVYMASHFYLDDFPQSSEPLTPDEVAPPQIIGRSPCLSAQGSGRRCRNSEPSRT